MRSRSSPFPGAGTVFRDSLYSFLGKASAHRKTSAYEEQAQREMQTHIYVPSGT
jgi:hypothetical protein